MTFEFRRKSGAVGPATRLRSAVPRGPDCRQPAQGQTPAAMPWQVNAAAARADLSRLRFAERFLVWAVRRWSAGHRSDALPCPVLGEAFLVAGLLPGLGPLYCVMTHLVAGARGPVDVRAERCRSVGTDERTLLDLLGSAQSGDIAIARTILHGWMAPAAARLSEGPLHTLAAALTQRGYHLRRRQDASTRVSDPGIGTIH